MHDADILVAGGGPAGVVAAIGLARAAYCVTLVNAPRRPDTVEGFSERVLQAVERAGCVRARATLGAAVRREASWNGTVASANREWVVARARFDAALLEDARAAGVETRTGHVRAARADAQGGRLELGDGTVWRGRFLVEARGRRAPGRRIRGPATTALSGSWCHVPRRPRTAVAPFRDGWAWFASTGDGRASLQIAVSTQHDPLPPRADLEKFYAAAVARVPEGAEWLNEACPSGSVAARHAGMSRAVLPIEPGLIRVGDAALALDPLSGHGAFEAIASATAAVPVVRTLLTRPENADLARSFYEERARTAFERFSRIGRDFYRLERRWPEASFWAERRAWPNDLPAHADPASSPPAIAEKPVVADGFIEARRVIVTADQPRGVWQVAGVPLVELLEWWRGEPAPSPEQAARRFGRAPNETATALAWLEHRRLLG